MKILLNSPEDTEAIGAKLAQVLTSHGTVFLQGQLGAGKTTLVRGFLRAVGYCGTVKSPTYTLVEEYALQTHKIYHFDLYRVNDPEELDWMGIQDYFTDDVICFVEWPEMGAGLLPVPEIILQLSVEKQGHILEIKKMPKILMTAFEKQ